MPRTAEIPATRIVHSNVIGMNAIQLFGGRPPMFRGYSRTEAQYCRPKPPRPPTRPPIRTSSGTRDGPWPIASLSSSIGYGVYASITT